MSSIVRSVRTSEPTTCSVKERFKSLVEIKFFANILRVIWVHNNVSQGLQRNIIVQSCLVVPKYANVYDIALGLRW